tara:strand:+ start:505 stop:690 length:186 start_codon:yes stop_codon:yes gene_type:complete
MPKIEKLIEQSQTTLSYIRDKEYAWEVNSINNNLARIQELLDDINVKSSRTRKILKETGLV